MRWVTAISNFAQVARVLLVVAETCQTRRRVGAEVKKMTNDGGFAAYGYALLLIETERFGFVCSLLTGHTRRDVEVHRCGETETPNTIFKLLVILMDAAYKI